jgi:hypothetical protein
VLAVFRFIVNFFPGFYCFAAKTGGDVIGFASHIKGVTAKDAALFLAQSLSQSPQERNSGKDHGVRTIASRAECYYKRMDALGPIIRLANDDDMRPIKLLRDWGKPNSRVTSRQTGNMLCLIPIHIRRFAEGYHPDGEIRLLSFQNQVERQSV